MGKIVLATRDMQQKLTQYRIAGRAIPTEKNPEPTVYRMRIFARNHVVAKSRFWYFMQRLQRVKKAHGQILECIPLESNPTSVKNYAIWLRYDSRTGTHNMYKEFRDISEEGAVSRMYADMAGRHRARGQSIQVIKMAEIKDEECRRPHITQLHAPDLKFPHVERKVLTPKDRRLAFSTRKPIAFIA
eukprot:Protomagalhaensia_wolfi_Nauph_80__2768@NODE_288_length_2910_cov_307_046325_g215_i0_p4_GENE_NODE_288_length_2910_cov_307_046325_g215_i0NODE_288_length_2910_cov_307_046325_g215_i0_p4_ORF_typecomplete_len187_score40_17Ribosomal_L18A/PF01775_17/4_5e49_NODE_288_length_2910_cov_307_046325_g215_i07711331